MASLVIKGLNDLKVIEDSWMKRIDRGGLWHEGIYVLFYAIEEIIRQHFTVRCIELYKCHSTKIKGIAA